MGWPSILPLCSPSLSAKLNLLVQKIPGCLKKKKKSGNSWPCNYSVEKYFSAPHPAPVDAALVVAQQTKLY